MANDKLRRRVAWEAARLMYTREEAEYFRAKLKAARRVAGNEFKPSDLPSNREIREDIQVMARSREGNGQDASLRQMRIEALRMMRLLWRFRPRLIGSTLTGHVRCGSDIDLHVFSDTLEPITALLESEGLAYEVEHKRVLTSGEEHVFRLVRVQDRFDFALTVHPTDKAHHAFKSSITGKPIERASIAELEQLLAEEYPHVVLDQSVLEAESKVDRFRVYEMLLLPLEQVKENPRLHPEGDALYHSLQVFELARDALPYDEEFLLAALLHDVGKAIDPKDHVAAGLEALEGLITPRTAWLIEHHPEAHALREGTLGARARRRLEASEDYEELKLLAQCDLAGRARGVAVVDVREALDYLRDLAQSCGE